MKKSFVLFLAVVMALGLAIIAVACDGEETTAPSDEVTTISSDEVTTTVAEEVTTTEAGPVVYDHTEAWDHIGEEGTITGVVLKVSNRIEKALLVVDSTTNDVGAGTNARIMAVDWDKFGGFEGLEALLGKTITFTGLIETNVFANNKPEIEVSDPANLVIEDTVVYTSAEAWDHIGEVASLTGVVMELVPIGTEKVLLVVDSTTNEVGGGTNARVLATDYENFGGLEALEALVGKTITFTGPIEANSFANNKPEIGVSNPALLVVED